MKATAYLYFAGDCAEALQFYRDAIGADIRALVRFGDMPGAPSDAQDKVALVQIAGAGKRPALYCRDFKLGARHSTRQAQVDLGHPDVPVRIVPCGCDASIRYRRS
jgi:hypothetical protein